MQHSSIRDGQRDDDAAGMPYAALWLAELGRVVPDDPREGPRWARDVRPPAPARPPEPPGRGRAEGPDRE